MATNGENYFTFLSQGLAFARTFSIFMDRLDIFLTISGLVHLPAILLTIVVVLALAPVSDNATENHIAFIHAHMGSVMTIAYIQTLVSSLVTLVGEGGMVRATAEIYAGRNPEWYPSFRFGLSKFWPLVGASVIVMAAYFAVGLVTLLLFSICMVLANSKLGFLFLLVGIAVAVVGLCAALYIYMTVIPLYTIIIIEEKGPVNALHRCMELCRGRRAYFFVGVFLLLVVQYLLQHLLHAIFFGGDPASFFFAPAGAIVAFLPNVMYVPLVTIFSTVLYMSVRTDKEGLNQQVLGRELSDPVEYSPPVSDYRRVALVDERQEPNLVATPSDDDFA